MTFSMPTINAVQGFTQSIQNIQVAYANTSISNYIYFTNTASQTSPLSVSCVAHPSTSSNNITWNASVSGGSGSYSYSWSVYNDVASYGEGSTQSSGFQALYNSSGTKEAIVSVKDSSGTTLSATCTGTLATSQTTTTTTTPTPALVTGTETITPNTQTIASGQNGMLNFTYPSNTVKATLFFSCPSGITGAAGECNTYIPVTSNGNYSPLFTNSTSNGMTVVANYYTYSSANPNFANGVAASITVQPGASTVAPTVQTTPTPTPVTTPTPTPTPTPVPTPTPSNPISSLTPPPAVSTTPLSTSCSGMGASDGSNSIVWSASASGGTGSYSYSWQPYDDFIGSGSGSGQSLNLQYDSGGMKQTGLRVSDGKTTATASCSTSVGFGPGSVSIGIDDLIRLIQYLK